MGIIGMYVFVDANHKFDKKLNLMKATNKRKK